MKRTISLILAVIMMAFASVTVVSADTTSDFIEITDTIEVWHTHTGITFNPQIVMIAHSIPLVGRTCSNNTPWLKNGEYIATSSLVPYYAQYDNYVKVGKLNANCEYRIVFYDASGAWVGYTARSAALSGEVCINALEIESGSTVDAVAYKVVSYAPGMTVAMWKKSQRYATKTVCRVKATAEYTGNPAYKDKAAKFLEQYLFGD